jgi:hypothetical protein
MSLKLQELWNQLQQKNIKKQYYGSNKMYQI